MNTLALLILKSKQRLSCEKHGQNKVTKFFHRKIALNVINNVLPEQISALVIQLRYEKRQRWAITV